MEIMSAEEYKSRSLEYEMKEAKKGLIAHGSIISVVSIILATANLTFTPGFLWFVFPVLGMSIGVLAHYIFGSRLIPVFLDDKERRIENWH